MALPAVGEAFSSGGAYVARSISESFQTFGHKVSTVLSDYVMPTLRKCSNLAKTCFTWLTNTLRTGVGGGVLLGLLGVGFMLFSQRGESAADKDNTMNKVTRTAFRVLGILLVAGGVTLAVVYGGAAWI